MNETCLTRLDLNLLVVFDTIMTERSLTKAGKRLGMTQSAVSHSLARLRKIANDQLFERTGRGIRPTPRATSIAQDVSDALAVLRGALSDRRSPFNSRSANRQFFLDIPAGLDACIAPELAVRTVGASNVSFRISGGRARNVLSQLRDGETWLALDYELPDVPGFCNELLFEDPFVVIARKGHPRLDKGLPLDVYRSLEHVALIWGRGSTPVADYFERAGGKRNVRFGVPNVMALPYLVESHDCVAAIPMRIARTLAKRFKIEIHALPGPVPPMPVHMIWHESLDDDEAHRWLREIMRDACKAL